MEELKARYSDTASLESLFLRLVAEGEDSASPVDMNPQGG